MHTHGTKMYVYDLILFHGKVLSGYDECYPLPWISVATFQRGFIRNYWQLVLEVEK